MCFDRRSPLVPHAHTDLPCYLVAITRWADGRMLDAELPLLAELLGLQPYDARLRLSAPLPIVLAHGAEVTIAQAWVAALRGRGHGVVACDAGTVPSEESALIARGFELQQQALVITDRPGRAFTLAWADTLGMFHAAE